MDHGREALAALQLERGVREGTLNALRAEREREGLNLRQLEQHVAGADARLRSLQQLDSSRTALKSPAFSQASCQRASISAGA